MKRMMVVFLALFFSGISSAFAHFQMVYTPKTALTTEDNSRISLKLVFTHPFEAGHTMSMGMDEKSKINKPAVFAMINKGETTDLL